jgi:hypothetical protein
MNLAGVKARVLLWLLGGYLLLSYSFMQLRIPPSSFGIPLGELFLVFALLTTNVPLVFSRMAVVVSLVPFLTWWCFGIGRLMVDSINRGFWSFRDGTQVLESLYLIVGFAAAANSGIIEKLMRHLPIVLAVLCIYGLGFPFQDYIAALSPKLAGAQGQPIPVFGYTTTPSIMLWTAFYCLVAEREGPPRVSRAVIACFLIGFAVLLVQSRTTYLQIFGLAAVVLIFRPQALGKMTLAIPAVLLALGLLAAFQIRVPGALTSEVSVSFLADHFASIFGIGSESGESGVSAAARGVDLRLHWWINLYDRLTDDAVDLLTGLGYGIPLTDFSDTLGVTTREPHNSYISVVARLGVLGFAVWFWMQVALFAASVRAYWQCRRLRWESGEDFLLMVIAFAVLLLIAAFGEDSMEKPYDAIPYYALFGFALRIAFAFRTRDDGKSERPRPYRSLADASRPHVRRGTAIP